MKKVDFAKQTHWYSPWNVPALHVEDGDEVTFQGETIRITL